MSVLIIGTGGGRATLRRIDAKQNDPAARQFTAARAQEYNDLLTELAAMADTDHCPADPNPE